MVNSLFTNLFSLKGHVALVTGASGGIGREIAHTLAMAGAHVALSGRSAERIDSVRQAITERGGTAMPFAGDLDSLETFDPLLRSIEDVLGPVDILINCAGINRREPILEVNQSTFSEIIDVNLRVPYFLSQAVLPFMVENGGKIVNVGSLTTSWGVGNLSVYGLSKSAIGQMTRVMSVEWAQHDVQVNCICPGWIETELTKPLWADPAKRQWLLDRIPAGRPGTPNDLVGLVLYLCSPAARYTTGQTFYVDGGFTAGGQW